MPTIASGLIRESMQVTIANPRRAVPVKCSSLNEDTNLEFAAKMSTKSAFGNFDEESATP